MEYSLSPTSVPEGRQPLLVPEGLRDKARSIGAKWHADSKIWSMPADKIGDIPRPMLPMRDRPGLTPPYIVINLVPQASWGRNMRALMSKDDWRAFARNWVYAMTGSVCLICGDRGPQWPVEADEVWRYDDANGIQSLHKVIPLCPSCHEVRSCGMAIANGRDIEVAEHLAWVERISMRKAEKRIEEAMDTWQRRSSRHWTIDLSAAQEKYGISLEHDMALTDSVNHELVREAGIRARSNNGSISMNDVLSIMTSGHSGHRF